MVRMYRSMVLSARLIGVNANEPIGNYVCYNDMLI